MQKLRKEIETTENNQMELLELKWKILEAKKIHWIIMTAD